MLIADGAYDRGDLESAIAGAVSAGTRLITRSSARVGEADSAVLRVSARSQVAAGRPMAIGAEIYSPSPRRARVQIWLGERLAGSGEVELAAGVSAFTVRAEAPMTVGAVVVAAEMLDPRSQSLANDVINKVVEVIEPPPVVVVGEAPALTAALTRQGVTVDQITARRLPTNAEELATKARVDLGRYSGRCPQPGSNRGPGSGGNRPRAWIGGHRRTQFLRRRRIPGFTARPPAAGVV